MSLTTLCKTHLCTGCEACCQICPESAINISENHEGFWYPTIDINSCSECKKCERVCPVIIRPKIDRLNEPVTLACWHKDSKVRELSSSGGVFSALAEIILSQGGVVFGAAYDSNLNVSHKHIENIADIDTLRRSKYVQSRIGNNFHKVKEFLKNDRKVLFVGTPCQIAGLLSFIGGDQTNLITVDFICHGVPSPKVFNKYLEELESKHSCKFTDFNFRDKRRGWLNNSVVGSTANGKEIVCKGQNNSFFNGFILNTFLRTSCYQCPMIGLPRFGNLTIADFWGLHTDEDIPQQDLDQGISLLLLNDEKTKEQILEDLSQKLILIKRSFSEAQNGNAPMMTPSKKPENRGLFFNELDRLPFIELTKKYLTPSRKRKLDQFIKENCSPGVITIARKIQAALKN